MLLLFKSFRKVRVFKSFVVTHRKCRRVFVVEYFENKLGNNRVLFLQERHSTFYDDNIWKNDFNVPFY